VRISLHGALWPLVDAEAHLAFDTKAAPVLYARLPTHAALQENSRFRSNFPLGKFAYNHRLLLALIDHHCFFVKMERPRNQFS
jgi:hypothetical protein